MGIKSFLTSIFQSGKDSSSRIVIKGNVIEGNGNTIGIGYGDDQMLISGSDSKLISIKTGNGTINYEGESGKVKLNNGSGVITVYKGKKLKVDGIVYSSGKHRITK